MRRSVGVLATLGAFACLAGGRAEDAPQAAPAADFARYLKSAYGEAEPPEGARMLMAILEGSQMGPGEGWFGPAESRYGYDWLAERLGIEDPDIGIARDSFPGTDQAFAVLDRNGDGAIQSSDMDWSDGNPFVRVSYALGRIFRRLDTRSAGGLTKDEWIAIFDEAAGTDGQLSAREFAARLSRGEGSGFTPGDKPTTESLVRGLLAGEIGSIYAGPQVGDRAPVFRLRQARGEGTIGIDSLLGEKPLVLVFGNVTCGPFRSFYPAVDALQATYGDRAEFLMVYVREAHPEDGWKMESNARAGVAVQQPRSFAERVEVAGQFCTKLEPSMPVVVDDVNDSVGHAYSGMPARLYLVDREGRVAYKSGRGPFGFIPGELEQAIVMHLLDVDGTSASDVPASP